MKRKTTSCGPEFAIEWDDERHTGRFIVPLMEMIDIMKTPRSVNREEFCKKYSLLPQEFDDIVGFAELIVQGKSL